MVIPVDLPDDVMVALDIDLEIPVFADALEKVLRYVGDCIAE